MPTDSVSHATGGGYPSPQYQEFLRALGRRWSCIPVLVRLGDPRRDKHPDLDLLEAASGVRGWRLYRTRLPGPADVEAWRDAEGFGVVTGEVSGRLCVLDVDPRNGGLESMAGRHLQPTPAARTWSSKSRAHGEPGVQYYLRGDGTERTAKNLLPGVDLLAGGAYAVLPGPEGREWLISPEDEDLAPLPEWVRDLLRDQSDNADSTPSKKTVSGSTVLGAFPRTSAQLGGLDLAREEETARRLVESAGRAFPGLGRTFGCILPGHEERSPSASIVRGEDGWLRYMDYHRRGPRAAYSLGHVWAALHGRGPDVPELSRAAQATWTLRMLVELGMVELPDLGLRDLPWRTSGTLVRVWDSIRLLYAVRHLYDPDQEPRVALASRFLALWAGVDPRTARKGVAWLEAAGYLTVSGSRSAVPRLYSPGAAATAERRQEGA